MGVQRVKRETFKVIVRFEQREDGGLRAWSDDVPGFVLSHPDASAVLDDVEPALETILSEMHGGNVIVSPLVDLATLYEKGKAKRASKRQCAPLQLPSQKEYASRLGM